MAEIDEHVIADLNSLSMHEYLQLFQRISQGGTKQNTEKVGGGGGGLNSARQGLKSLRGQNIFKGG